MKARGVKARKEEWERLRYIKFIESQNGEDVFSIDSKSYRLIRDLEKDPNVEDSLFLLLHSDLIQRVVEARVERVKLDSEDLVIYTDIPIDPAIITEYRAYKLLKSKRLSGIRVNHSDSEEEKEKVESESEKEKNSERDSDEKEIRTRERSRRLRQWQRAGVVTRNIIQLKDRTILSVWSFR